MNSIASVIESCEDIRQESKVANRNQFDQVKFGEMADNTMEYVHKAVGKARTEAFDAVVDLPLVALKRRNFYKPVEVL